MKSSLEAFLELMEANRNGLAKGIYSVCTAHPEVLEASFKQAKRDKSLLLIESTSNQVDQYGGYTGMKPLDFVEFINGIAEKTDFPKEMILLGGDHGSNCIHSEAFHQIVLLLPFSVQTSLYGQNSGFRASYTAYQSLLQFSPIPSTLQL
jgi:tagatose-1,6-bisphosphate aldolase non-catalytic subunit AgaZ/GatZ